MPWPPCHSHTSTQIQSAEPYARSWLSKTTHQRKTSWCGRPGFHRCLPSSHLPCTLDALCLASQMRHPALLRTSNSHFTLHLQPTSAVIQYPGALCSVRHAGDAGAAIPRASTQSKSQPTQQACPSSSPTTPSNVPPSYNPQYTHLHTHYTHPNPPPSVRWHTSVLCHATAQVHVNNSSPGHTTHVHLQVGCGADELIDLLLRCVLEPGDAIIDSPPTFGMYAFDTDVCGGRVVTVPRRPDFSLDVPAITAAVAAERPKALFLTSPNNPDGSMLPEADLLALLALPVLVVLDEAYVEFSGVATRMPWVTEVPNLVVLRTFSKSAGLAGLRVGCGPLSASPWIWRTSLRYSIFISGPLSATPCMGRRSG